MRRPMERVRSGSCAVQRDVHPGPHELLWAPWAEEQKMALARMACDRNLGVSVVELSEAIVKQACALEDING